jgi:hypothetical protein
MCLLYDFRGAPSGSPATSFLMLAEKSLTLIAKLRYPHEWMTLLHSYFLHKYATSEEPSIYNREICMTMFIATLFTIMKLWNEDRCLLTDEWIKKTQYMYTLAYCLAIKKNEIMSLAENGWN